MHANTEKLRRLMATHGLSVQDVADLLKRKPVTVYGWHAASDFRVIPDVPLELLRFRLKEMARKRVAR